jgi:uncharacterized membrane protein
MMRGKAILFCMVLLSILLVAPLVQGAVLHGAIYDDELEPISRTVVYINSTPQQRHISRYGGYSFSVNPGSYLITANLTLNNITRTIATEEVYISRDGDYRIDLFAADDINISAGFQGAGEEDNSMFLWLITIIGTIAVIAIVLVALRLGRRLHKLEKREKTVDALLDRVEEKDVQDDPLIRRIMVMLKDNKGKMAQKDIRKVVRFSEAKVSMALSRMEELHLIKKKREGRENYILVDDSNNSLQA